jgi:hypothetical protein
VLRQAVADRAEADLALALIAHTTAHNAVVLVSRNVNCVFRLEFPVQPNADNRGSQAPRSVGDQIGRVIDRKDVRGHTHEDASLRVAVSDNWFRHFAPLLLTVGPQSEQEEHHKEYPQWWEHDARPDYEHED